MEDTTGTSGQCRPPSETIAQRDLPRVRPYQSEKSVSVARALSRAARQECCRYRSDYSEGGIIDWNLQCARILGLVRGYIGQGVDQEMLELLIEEGERNFQPMRGKKAQLGGKRLGLFGTKSTRAPHC